MVRAAIAQSHTQRKTTDKDIRLHAREQESYRRERVSSTQWAAIYLLTHLFFKTLLLCSDLLLERLLNAGEGGMVRIDLHSKVIALVVFVVEILQAPATHTHTHTHTQSCAQFLRQMALTQPEKITKKRMGRDKSEAYEEM